MTATIFDFKPRQGGTAAANLADFIRFCRDGLTLFGGIDWDSASWEVTGAFKQKAGENKKKRILYFRTGSHGTPPFPEPFASFAKAYLRYTLSSRCSDDIMKTLIVMLRALCSVLPAGKNIHELGMIDFNRAEEQIKKTYAGDCARRLGIYLEHLAESLSTLRLVSVPFQHKNTIKGKPRAKSSDKMTTTAQIESLQTAYRNATTPTDILSSSLCAILLSMPSRQGELFRMSRDVLRSHAAQDVSWLSLVWYPEKGAPPMQKVVPTAAAELVRDALRRMLEVTAPGHEIAEWYSANPTKIHLPSGFEHLRDKGRIGFADIETLCGLTNGMARFWVLNKGIKHADQSVLFADFEKAILKMLPAGFPYAWREGDLEYKDALLVVRKGECALGGDRIAPMLCIFEPFTVAMFNHAISGGIMAKKGGNLFSRTGCKTLNQDGTESDGIIGIRSHSFRHLLNTVAQRKMLSQVDIANWSGRKDIRQNAAYDHRTKEEKLALIRSVSGEPGSGTEIFDPASINEPVLFREFVEETFPQVSTVHATEIGFCIHDFVLLPCSRFVDCLRCEESVCVKGYKEKADRVRGNLAVAEAALAKAETEIEEGTRGADRWVVVQRDTVARLRELLAVLEDPDIPAGTIVRLGGIGQSALAKTPRLALPGANDKKETAE